MTPAPPNSPLYLAGIAVLMGVLMVLDAFNIWHATQAEKDALLYLFAALGGGAAVGWPILTHARAVHIASLTAPRGNPKA